ncbi:MAG: N-acetyl-alpha-D-glucosaminyl L-malate synthase BshA [Planctomycetes bacterium]|nr:N-acetyl-alpha-D-glucosaminyl L-malate synthase BshA [Planctomycetota bacterium]
MRPLRVGIACYPTYGGSGVMATELGIALAERGHEVHLFSYAWPSRLPACHPGLQFHGVTVSDYPLFRYPPYDLALASSLREVMQRRELDVVHAHYAVPHALCAWMAREMLPGCRTRIVTTLHGTDATILGRDPGYRDVIRFGLQRSDAVVCVSRWLEQQTHEVYDFGGAVAVIPNFVDQRRFRPRVDERMRRELGGGRAPLLLHTSNYRPLKRAADTVDVLARLPQRDALLVLVGDGPDLPLLRERAERAGVAGRLRLLGEVPDAETATAACDVALLPSSSESFGLAALEAMACGLPVVASRVGGLPEVVVHGETGFLEPVGDTAAMAADVQRLLDDPDLRRAQGAAALRRTSAAFSLERCVSLHEELYGSLTHQPS